MNIVDRISFDGLLPIVSQKVRSLEMCRLKSTSTPITDKILPFGLSIRFRYVVS